MQAHRRLRQIVATATAAPPAVAAQFQLRPSAVVAAPTLVELEGEAIGRFIHSKVCLLKVGERGGSLAPASEVDKLFSQRGLEPVSAESVEAIPSDAEVLVTTGTPVNAKVLEKAPKLKLVAVAFTGIDHIDVAACRARGVAVVNVPGYSTDATAELVVGLVISHLRRLSECHHNIIAGRWACPPQEDLKSKTVGIIGVGKIGLRLAELFKAFKVKDMIGYSLHQDPEFLALGGKYLDSLAGLFLDADIICICVPLTETSQGMITDKLMGLLRPECILVNVSRGGVLDEAALVKHLAAKRFRAALDVFNVEPLPADSPLRKISPDTLLMTPHIGFQSEASLERRLDVTVKNILAYLAGQAINIV